MHRRGTEVPRRREFDVGPVGLRVAFGDDRPDREAVTSTGPTFVRKYLEAAADGSARAITAVPGKGLISPGTKATGGGQEPTADGSADHPFLVQAEFEVMFTTTIPTVRLDLGQGEERHLPSQVLGVSPVGKPAVEPLLRLRILDAHGVDHLAALAGPGGGAQAHIVPDVSGGGSFPLGVWGPPQPDDDRKVPSGDVVIAVDGVRLPLDANVAPGRTADPVRTGRSRARVPQAAAVRARPRVATGADGGGRRPRARWFRRPPTRTRSRTRSPGCPEPSPRNGERRAAALALDRRRAAPPMLGSLTGESRGCHPGRGRQPGRHAGRAARGRPRRCWRRGPSRS